MIRLTANEARMRAINSMTDTELLAQTMYACACVRVYACALITADRFAFFFVKSV